mgnify:CR=1 FL=1
MSLFKTLFAALEGCFRSTEPISFETPVKDFSTISPLEETPRTKTSTKRAIDF